MSRNQGTNQAGRIELFCAYSHRDDDLRAEFKSSVAVLRQENWIDLWTDQNINAGDYWEEEIKTHLNNASIVVLLVSSDFLSSDYCYRKEMARALEREKEKEVVVIPIIVRECDWSDAPFAKLRVLPERAKAVTLWPNRDDAWTNVARGVKTVVKLLLERAQMNESSREKKKGPSPTDAGHPGYPSETIQKIEEKIAGIQADLDKSGGSSGREAFASLVTGGIAGYAIASLPSQHDHGNGENTSHFDEAPHEHSSDPHVHNSGFYSDQFGESYMEKDYLEAFDNPLTQLHESVPPDQNFLDNPQLNADLTDLDDHDSHS